MSKLTRTDLYSLEDYAMIRNDFRAKVMAHKKSRNIELGDHVILYFEDRLIMQYQIQEMLRAEKIFDADGIEEELAAYNPLIPDGNNWKVTMMIQYTDIDERRTMLQKLIGVDRLTWVQVEGHEKVFAISDEDMDRESEEKTSAVHFMRFELTAEMISALKNDADLSCGIDHENYNYVIKSVETGIKQALIEDLQLST